MHNHQPIGDTMILEALKTIYDDQPIGDIQNRCSNYKAISNDNRKDFILCLYYLERTKRFKENKVYEKASFEKYISDCFNLRYTTYNKERMAFIAHPQAASKWGAGLVERIRRECGAGKINDVVLEIESTENVTHAKIDKIIEKSAKAKPEKPAVDTKKTLENENARSIKTIADYIKTIAELTEQIERLKKTIDALRIENEVLKYENASLRQENEILKSENNKHRDYASQIFLNPLFSELKNEYQPNA